jgi:hypothetical protein
MKSLLSKLLVASCVLAIVAVAFAADDNQKGKKRKKANDPTAGIKRKLEKAELPAETLEKAEKIVEEHAPKIKEAQEKLNAALTDEQRKARREAQQAAKAAGKKGREAAAEVDAALKLTDDQKKAYEEAQKGVQEANAAMNKALSEVLSDEEEAKVGIKGGKGGKRKKKNA